MKTAYIFDFDGTLVNCDKEWDKITRYENPKFKEFIEPMHQIFKLLQLAGENVFILTNRNSKCKDFISNILNIRKEFIITRNYCLKESEIDRVIKMEKNNNLEPFLEDMDNYKNFFLNRYIYSFNFNIIYYDDLYIRLINFRNKYHFNNERILILPPVNGDVNK